MYIDYYNKKYIALIDRYIILLLGCLIILSGYLYANIDDNIKTHSREMRFAVIILINYILLFGIILKKKPSFPSSMLPLVIFILYITMISIFYNDIRSYISPLARWSSFFLAASYIFSSKVPLSCLKKYIDITSALLLFSILFDIVSGRTVDINNAHRIYGSTGSPIGFSSILYITALVNLYFYATNHGKRYLFMTLFLFAGIVLTTTRSVAIAAVLSYSFYYIVQRGISIRNTILAFTILVLITITSILLYNYSEIGNRIALLFGGESGDYSSYFRLFIISTALDNFSLNNLITGIGLGGFPAWFERQTGNENIAPHLEIVWLIIEGGIIGAILYISAFGVIVNEFRKALKKKLIDLPLFWLGVIAILSLQFTYQFTNPTFYFQTMIPIFFILGSILKESKCGKIVIE